MANVIPNPAVIDFETKEIKNRPVYPPIPVGVSIDEPGCRPKYYAWGHPTENNCTKEDAIKALKRVYNKYPILCHNAKFDLDVCNIHLGLPLIPKYGFHDTEFLAFLVNPHAESLALKKLAEEHLDMPPDEQDSVHLWIRENIYLSSAFKYDKYKIFIGSKKPIGYVKVPPTKAGAFIGYAPGKLVGKYAIGDTTRTKKLFKKLYKEVLDRGMLRAYQREIALMPILLKNERIGIKIHERSLRKDVKIWDDTIECLNNHIRKRVKNKDLNVSSNEDLADALEKAGFIGEWVLTDKGNRSTSKENLPLAVADQNIIDVLAFRSKLCTMSSTFGHGWLKRIEHTNGFLNCYWSQVRNENERSGGKGGGARTGRIQSSPNFQNIPKKPDPMALPKSLINELNRKGLLIEQPQMRSYIIPDSKDHLFGHRDYSQQELRIMGHFEDGVLCDAYNEDPDLDLHDLAMVKINEMLGTNFARKPIKNMGFGLIYGMGNALLGANMGIDTRMAKSVKETYLEIFPGLGKLIKDLKKMAENGEALTTWGGRQYYCEEPKYNKDTRRMQTFEYKMLNYLIQGSAADCTKEAIIRCDSVCKNSRMMLTVHDEINQSMPKECFYKEMALMKEAMASVEFDVPMKSDGKKSVKNWQAAKPFTKVELKRYNI